MILNSGLDAACTLDASGSNSSSSGHPYFCQFIRYAAFGTGTSAPDPTDTTLDSQVGDRSNSLGGFATSEDAGLDAGTDTIWYEGTFTRTFSIASNVNATEWGLAPQPTGNLSVRDLFRADPNDPESTPISLTLEEGDQLQLVVTFRVQATWEYETKTFTITGAPGNDTNGTHDGRATVSPGNATNTLEIARALSAVWPGGPLTGTGNFVPYTTDQSSVGKNQNMSGSTTTVSGTADGYTPGANYRDWTGVWSTSQANGDHYAWNVGQSTGRGFRFILDDPATLVKASTHRLTLTLRKHIARL